MKYIYLISILLLIISFLLLKKTSKKENIINSIIYNICFIIPYQTLLVYLFHLLNIDGNLLYYTFVNIFIALILLILTINKKQIQHYYIQKKELLLYLSLIFIIFITIFIRFRGFTILTYLSDDSSIHYRMAMNFKRELSYLTTNNSKDLLYKDFAKAMPASYINGGFFLKIFENYKPYKVFIIYDMLCLILSSLLFLSTLIKLYQNKKNNYLYIFIISILYSISFPLNNLLYGFFYLGIGIMIINLIFITIKEINNNLNKNIYINLIILFILNLSLFFSYYLFIPNIYLTLGIYYILLYKQKKINLKTLLKYSIITLILPFIIGFIHFLLPSLFKEGSFVKAIIYEGAIYDNLTPLYLFILFIGYLCYKIYHKKLNFNNYTFLNIYIISLYGVIFLILYIFKIAKLYYFYKLFYLLSLFIAIALSELLINKKKILYKGSIIIAVLLLFPLICGNNNISTLISKTNIYSYNSNEIFNPNIRFTKKELDIIEYANKNKKICTLNHEFPIITRTYKKFWYYALTDTFPIINHSNKGAKQLDTPSIKLQQWRYYSKHPCLVYFYEDKKPKYQLTEYSILYKNNSGIILKKK
ncbi:MAG: O-antigen polymerase [Bacilli bacterium]|nr:O-antigen polymerase [Bacilli bacterium]